MPRDYVAREIAHLVDRRLPVDEFERRIAAPITDQELEETADLVRWFTRRYPTPKDRLRYARRKFEEWTRRAPIVSGRGPGR